MKINIHQIFYQEKQEATLDPAFIPFNNQNKTYPYSFEYAVFFSLFATTDWSRTDLLGTVSWKFHQKTGLQGHEFINQIESNPGFDVYFVNPFPELCIYRSVWDHGEEFHPRIKELTKQLLKASGYDPSLAELETPPNVTAYCNYWVANRHFWKSYINFLDPIWKYVTRENSMLNMKLKESADPFIGAPYLPFIFERLFSTFLSLQQSTLRSKSISVSPAKLMDNPFLSPISGSIQRVAQQNSHSTVSFSDRAAIYSLSKVRKWRHYSLPLLKRKLTYLSKGQ